MEKRHIFHLDWVPAWDTHSVNEMGESIPPPPEEICYVTRMLYCAGILAEKR